MRIISGSLKGRKLSGYDIPGTRPTMDKVKESMFAMIQDRINDRIALDLFAGTGSLGLEAISNGAKHCYFVDRNSKCTKVITTDVNLFGIKEQATILTMTAQKAIVYFQSGGVKFDLVFLDPPYKDFVIGDVLKTLKEKDLLNNQATIVCEMETNYELIDDAAFLLLKSRQYGPKTVLIYEYQRQK